MCCGVFWGAAVFAQGLWAVQLRLCARGDCALHQARAAHPRLLALTITLILTHALISTPTLTITLTPNRVPSLSPKTEPNPMVPHPNPNLNQVLQTHAFARLLGIRQVTATLIYPS